MLDLIHGLLQLDGPRTGCLRQVQVPWWQAQQVVVWAGDGAKGLDASQAAYVHLGAKCQFVYTQSVVTMPIVWQPLVPDHTAASFDAHCDMVQVLPAPRCIQNCCTIHATNEINHPLCAQTLRTSL